MNYCITIGRQYGSGGHEIGEKLANALNIPFYDNALIDRVAKDSGLCKEIIAEHDERPTSSFLYNLVMDTYSGNFSSRGTLADLPFGQKIFLAQFDTVKKVASEGPCVIVGRCADYILKERKDLVTVFIYADTDFRIKRIKKDFPDLSDNKIKDLLDKKDRERASYYNYYSDNKWGRATTYDLCLNSSNLGIEGSVKLIENYLKMYVKTSEE